MQDLQNKAPKLYKAMILGIAMSVVSDMRRSQDRLKKNAIYVQVNVINGRDRHYYHF